MTSPIRTVSIVTPSYNQGRFLPETIESVLSQEGDFLLDYLVIDGGSTDESPEIIRRYDRRLQGDDWTVRCRGIRFRWVSEKDRGQADAITKGFGMAEGEILAWLNSDDTYLPGVISKVVALFNHKPDAEVVYGKTYFTGENGEILGKYPTEPFDPERLAMFNFICQPSTFFRKSAYVDVGGLDTDLRYAMDYDLWIRMAEKHRFEYLTEFLSTYRLHDLTKTMAVGDSADNQKEALQTVIKHYGWAPASRVYGCCHHRLKLIFPPALARISILLVPLSLLFAMVRYIHLNRGIRVKDLKTINYRNLRKLFMKQIDIFKEY